VNVVYVAGLGRSGSTLLSRLLGQMPGWVAVGELHNIWRSGASRGRSDELCGCGRTFAECAFWRRVVASGLGGRSAAEASALASRVARLRHLPWLAGPWRPSGFSRRLASYAAVMSELYRGAAAEGNGRVVVDSSKDLGPLWMLTRAPEVRVTVLHLVRDPRGVAFSWSKRLRRREFVDREVLMPSWGALETAWRWTYSNLLAEAAGRRHGRYLRLRYEDLVRDPGGALAAIAHAVEPGEEQPPLPLVGDQAVLTRENHTLAGNPMRFESGRLPIRADESWRRDLPRKARWTVSALTWPLLRRYGYSVRLVAEGR